MKLIGEIHHYESKVDGQSYPYAICATDASKTPKPLIVEVSPQGFTKLPKCIERTEKIANWAFKHNEPCIVLRPTGRGDGSVYQHYGEVDVFEAIEDAKKSHAIDPDRISVAGSSMGGAAAWYLISHYPDFFSAAAPFSGYCDYRMWEKPGGCINHMNEWEEPAWISKSAVFLLENLRYTPVWMVHGEWDRAMAAGVPVEQSRQMARLFTEQGYDFKYTEVPKADHDDGSPEELQEEVFLWLLKQRKNRKQDHVVHAAYTLRHNTSFWVSIEQFARYGQKAVIDAQFIERQRIRVLTDNVERFSLALPKDTGRLEMEIDGIKRQFESNQSRETFCRRSGAQWERIGNRVSRSKMHGSSGPIGDMFFDNVLLVQGTSGTGEENYFIRYLLKCVPVHYRRLNGGVHRGTITGDNSVELRVIKDVDLSDQLMRQNNLILYGTHSTNGVLARFADKLPISFHGTRIRLYNKEYSSEYCAAFAVFPHPCNPDRYVAVHGGVKPDSIVWGSHLHMHLLPDYIVYSKGKVLDWGFVNNDWVIP